jgi:hypothetical protein
MFEIGKEYWIETGPAEHAGTSVYTVIEVNLPLIRVENVEGTRILNTHSPLFHSAQPMSAVDMTALDDF